MSQKNDESTALAMGAALLGAAALMFFAAIFAVAAFATFVLTILCLLSWNRPLKMGKFIFVPEESRAFVRRGIGGALLLPAFILFTSLLLNIHINWNYLNYMILGGYIGGSLGLAMLFAEDQQQTAAPSPEYIPPQNQLPAPPRGVQARHQPDTFRFASWDDEETQRNWEDEDDQE